MEAQPTSEVFATKKENRMPSLLHFIWQPHKKNAQERAKTVARRMSFKGSTPTPDQPAPGTRSNTRKTSKPISDPGHPQLNRAQQKSLKRHQKANESKASSSSGLTPLSTLHHPHRGGSVEYGHGPEHHQGMPIVPISARFGYLEHSGRALHLGPSSHLYFLAFRRRSYPSIIATRTESRHLGREPLSAIDESRIGDRVYFWARIHGTRALSTSSLRLRLCSLLCCVIGATNGVS